MSYLQRFKVLHTGTSSSSNNNRAAAAAAVDAAGSSDGGSSDGDVDEVRSMLWVRALPGACQAQRCSSCGCQTTQLLLISAGLITLARQVCCGYSRAYLVVAVLCCVVDDMAVLALRVPSTNTSRTEGPCWSRKGP